MPAEDTDKQDDVDPTHEKTALNSLTLQHAGCSSSPQRCSSPEVQRAKSLTADGSLPGPPAPAACTSPRIQSNPAKAGSRAAWSVQASKSPFAQSVAKRLVAQPAVRKSADAILVTARSSTSNSPKVSAFRQARQRKSLQASPASAADSVDDITAATRRSRVYFNALHCCAEPLVVHTITAACQVICDALYCVVSLQRFFWLAADED